MINRLTSVFYIINIRDQCISFIYVREKVSSVEQQMISLCDNVDKIYTAAECLDHIRDL